MEKFSITLKNPLLKYMILVDVNTTIIFNNNACTHHYHKSLTIQQLNGNTYTTRRDKVFSYTTYI